MFTYALANPQASVEQVAADYGLSTSTSLPFPSATQTTQDTRKLLVQDWSLGKGEIQTNPNNLAFVADPFPTKPVAIGTTKNTGKPVLQVTHPQGSFSSETGGAQFYNLWNATAGSRFQTMMVSYEVAFDNYFDWVKGGKLPGLRGSTKSNLGGCSSAKASTTNDCFSIRLMWRNSGNAESMLTQVDVDWPLTFDLWNRITLLIRLNDHQTANGNIQV
ncbi:hypothetical protein C0993_002181 [Termitomyces sp. T159_Od127]|nr:hypothetical protein C0993_002181 [Termitomyces sp. T159_Od127]